MSVPNLHETRTMQSMHVLSNAAELAALVIANVIGNDVSDSINGSRLTMTAIKAHVASRLRLQLTK